MIRFGSTDFVDTHRLSQLAFAHSKLRELIRHDLFDFVRVPQILLLHRRGLRALLSRHSDDVPFRALFYFNGHNWLASKLRKAKVAFLKDNAFADIPDWQKAQDLRWLDGHRASRAD